MFTYVFAGRVHPERCYVEITQHFPTVTIETEAPVVINMAYSSIVGQVMVIARTEAAQNVFYLKSIIEEVVATQVDFLSYRLGRHYSVEVISCVDLSTNNHVVFGVGHPVLEETQSERPLDYSDAANLAYRYVYLRRALSDLRRALGPNPDTASLCYRAIESIRQHMKLQYGVADGPPSWELVRTNLRVDEACLRYLASFSTPQRHGEIQPMSVNDLNRVTLTAWKIVDRFIIYLSNNEQALSEQQYNLIT